MALQLRFTAGAKTVDTASMTEASAAGAPNFTALPALSRQMPDASLFASRRALAAGGSWNDPVSSVKVWKLTDATTDPSGPGMNYSEGGPFISQRWGGTKYTIRLGSGVLIDLDTVTGISNRRSMPAAADVGFGFSMDPSTPRLCYYLSGSKLYAYDTATNAAVTTAQIPSTGRDFASVLNSTPYIEWLTVVQNGWMTFQANNPSDSLGSNARVCFFNVNTGETVTTSFADNNQLHPSRDGSAAFLATNTITDTKIWRRATNDIITITGLNGGHPAALTGAWVDINPHGSTFGTTRYTLATGTATEVLTMSQVNSSTGIHHSGHYPQSGAVTSQYLLSDSVGAHRAAPSGGTWTLQSGNIYYCTVDWAPAYQKATIGITGVFQYASSTLTNTLTAAASLGAMTAGSFWYDSALQRCYVWVVGGGSPAGKVALLAAAGNPLGLAFIRADGGDARLLCQHGNYNWGPTYDGYSFGTWSPNGLAALFRSSWGVDSGRMDFYLAIAPEA